MTKFFLLDSALQRRNEISDFIKSTHKQEIECLDEGRCIQSSEQPACILISKSNFNRAISDFKEKSSNIFLVVILDSEDTLLPNEVEIVDFILRDPIRNEELMLMNKQIMKFISTTFHDKQNTIGSIDDNYVLKYLLEHSQDAICYKDLKSRILNVNLAYVEYLGADSAEEVIGKTEKDFLPSDQALESLNDEKYIIETGESILNKPESILDTLGRKRWMLVSRIPFYDQSGKMTGIWSISRENTEQVETEIKLRHEKDCLQVLMDNIPDSVYFKDLNSKYLRVNEAYAKKLGLSSQEEAIGKTDFDLFELSYTEQTYSDEQQIISIGKSIDNKTEAVRFPGGQIRWMQTTRFPYKDETGTIAGVVGISHDITEQEIAKKSLTHARQKAEEANVAKSQFLANMSHEIRTPMNGVIGMADILKRTNLSPQQDEYVDIILRSGNNLIDIINDILDFSKIESGKIILERIPFSIRNIIEEIGDLLSTKASNKGINLATFIEPDVPELVKGDPVRLKQILLNLVNNGIKFTSEGDVIINVKLNETSEDKYEMYFEVIDSGIGIPDDAQAYLFDSFTQVDPSTTRKFGGSGLGLAISKRLAEQMGGEIGVASNVNSGSKFWFTAIFDKESLENNNPTIIHGKDFSKLKLLIIDDNRINRQIFTNYFQIWKCGYDEAVCAAEGLEKMKEEQEKGKPFDMVLVDYQMAEMDGLSFARHLLKDSSLKRVPIALLSSVCDLIPKHEFEALGINGALNKPIKLKQLYNLLMTLLGTMEVNRKILEKKEDPYSFVGMDLKVLVVEDNPINSKVAVIALKDYAGKIEIAENGQQAVDLCKRNKYDVILMDLHMPVMNGYEATKVIREMEAGLSKGERTNIIAMTANVLKEDMEECMEIGMDAFLSKPFRVNDMLRVLAELEIAQDEESILN